MIGNIIVIQIFLVIWPCCYCLFISEFSFKSSDQLSHHEQFIFNFPKILFYSYFILFLFAYRKLILVPN